MAAPPSPPLFYTTEIDCSWQKQSTHIYIDHYYHTYFFKSVEDMFLSFCAAGESDVLFYP